MNLIDKDALLEYLGAMAEYHSYYYEYDKADFYRNLQSDIKRGELEKWLNLKTTTHEETEY